MKLFNILFIILISIPAWSQIAEQNNIPCKPLAQMARHYDRLAKASQRADLMDWDVHYYDLNIDIDVNTEIIHGLVAVHLTSKLSSLENIQLDLSDLLTVDSVFINGAEFTHASNIVSITLDGSYGIDEAVIVGIAYHGHPIEGGFQSFSFATQDDIVNGIPMISTLSEPYGARSWWPCKDVPTDKADSVRIGITVDETLTAVANGLLVSETDNLDGTKTWIWEHKYPITTYLVSLAITEYEYWSETFHFADGDSMPLEYWMYPMHVTDDNVDIWNRTSGMITIFNEVYGNYPFSKEKYGMAQFDWGNGAMEHQTCSSIGGTYGYFSENTNAHELAHQWWGDLVTCSDFHHIWINEGFATYSEALYWGAKNGDAAYHGRMEQLDLDFPGSIYRYDTTSASEIFDYIVYYKGAWTLHMLRHVVSDETFFEILTQFQEKFRFSHASTEDFQAVAESVWGKDLEWFFDQWIYGSEKPNYRWSWNVTEQKDFGATEITIRIVQIQSKPAPIFKMPIDLRFEGDGFDTTMVIWDSLADQSFTIDLDFPPNTVRFDQQAWIHKEASLAMGVDDSGHLPGVFQLLEAYPNPFNDGITVPYKVDSQFEGQLSIFDLKGVQVYSIRLSHNDPGQYSVRWHGKDGRGRSLSSGIYIAQIHSANKQAVAQKISLLK